MNLIIILIIRPQSRGLVTSLPTSSDLHNNPGFALKLSLVYSFPTPSPTRPQNPSRNCSCSTIKCLLLRSGKSGLLASSTLFCFATRWTLHNRWRCPTNSVVNHYKKKIEVVFVEDRLIQTAY